MEEEIAEDRMLRAWGVLEGCAAMLLAAERRSEDTTPALHLEA